MQPLVELLHDLEQEMLRLGYAEGSMRSYRRRWQRLLQFSKEHGEVFYSERLGLDFIEKHFHILEKDLNNTLSPSDTNELRIIRMIGDFQLHHTVLRRYYHHKEILKEPYFVAIRDKFRASCENKDCSKTTINYYVKQCERFMDYLISQNIADFKSINIDLIHAYIKTLAGYANKTISDNICFIRHFLRFLLKIGETQVDFSISVPTIQCRQQANIPSVWTTDELKKLIAAIDRGSPTGKRDYAIILLTCYLGLRCGDLKNLKMEDFHWAEKKLIFVQSKTGASVILPLTQEVGWAVIDYLKYGRPKIDSPYVFVNHRVPFGPFSENNHLFQIIKKYRVLANLPIVKQKRGIHSLRHTMASMLLEKDTPLYVISSILGHVDPDATAIYLKVDIKKLKECALTFEEEVSHE